MESVFSGLNFTSDIVDLDTVAKSRFSKELPVKVTVTNVLDTSNPSADQDDTKESYVIIARSMKDREELLSDLKKERQS